MQRCDGSLRARRALGWATAGWLAAACGGAAPPPAAPRNTAPAGPHEIAPACFELDPVTVDGAFASWRALAGAATLRWIAGGEVPGLGKGKAWPAVAVSAIRPGSIYARMGLRDGDLVYAVDGHSLFGLDMIVNVLADPTLAAEMDAMEAEAPGEAPARPGPRDMIAMVAGLAEEPGAAALAVLRGGQPISVRLLVTGTPPTACARTPALREREAEERTWTDADWQADAARGEARQRAREAGEAAGAAVAAGITALTPTSFAIASSISAAALQQAAAHGARLTPAVTDGTPDGVRVFGVRPTSVFGALGIENGDRLRTIGGRAVTSPAEVPAAIGRLREQPQASIVLLRRGKPVTLDYVVR